MLGPAHLTGSPESRLRHRLPREEEASPPSLLVAVPRETCCGAALRCGRSPEGPLTPQPRGDPFSAGGERCFLTGTWTQIRNPLWSPASCKNARPCEGPPGGGAGLTRAPGPLVSSLSRKACHAGRKGTPGASVSARGRREEADLGRSPECQCRGASWRTESLPGLGQSCS